LLSLTRDHPISSYTASNKSNHKHRRPRQDHFSHIHKAPQAAKAGPLFTHTQSTSGGQGRTTFQTDWSSINLVAIKGLHKAQSLEMS